MFVPDIVATSFILCIAVAVLARDVLSGWYRTAARDGVRFVSSLCLVMFSVLFSVLGANPYVAIVLSYFASGIAWEIISESTHHKSGAHCGGTMQP